MPKASHACCGVDFPRQRSLQAGTVKRLSEAGFGSVDYIGFGRLPQEFPFDAEQFGDAPPLLPLRRQLNRLLDATECLPHLSNTALSQCELAKKRRIAQGKANLAKFVEAAAQQCYTLDR